VTEIRNYDTSELVAKAAAENAVEILNKAVEEKGSAVWVLAGGSSPLAAYRVLIKEYADAVDWSKVTVIIGDERFVPLDSPDSNWGAIMKLFDANEAFANMRRIEPDIQETVALTADTYNSKIAALGIERFDLVWLGVGEDGHTLSLFPNNPSFTEPPNAWVVPTYNSPKPPSERITLSLKALEYIVELVIFATGAAKRDVLREARLKGGLPIAVAAETAEMNGAEVRWLYDDAAWGER
jgi:6-phosphogluconolactonase